MKRTLFTMVILFTNVVSSQVLIDDTGNTEAEIHESAALQINSYDKGILLPRLAEEPQNAVGGLVYFDTNGKCLKAYDGTAWQVLGTECIPPTAYTINIEPAAEVNEGETLVYQISVSPEITDNTILTVDYATYVPSLSNPDDATPDEDYTAKNANITFTSDVSAIDIEVESINDNITEVDEKVYVQISNAVHVQGYSEVTIGTESAWGIITDNDVAYTLSVSTNPVVEGEVQEFVVSLDNTVEENTTITVGYYTLEETAVQGIDFTGVSGTLTFNSGEYEKTVNVQTINDGQPSGNKNYWFGLDTPSLSNTEGNHNVELHTTDYLVDALMTDADAPAPPSIHEEQDFSTNTNWAYTTNIAPYNVNDDIWGIVSSLGGITSHLSGNFWGMRDLNNNIVAGNERHDLIFNEVDISGMSDVVFSFDYASEGLNAGIDRYGYELFYDGNSQGETNICAGCNTDRNGTITINVPDEINSFKVIIYGQFDGANDMAGVDNIKISNQ